MAIVILFEEEKVFDFYLILLFFLFIFQSISQVILAKFLFLNTKILNTYFHKIHFFFALEGNQHFKYLTQHDYFEILKYIQNFDDFLYY